MKTAPSQPLLLFHEDLGVQFSGLFPSNTELGGGDIKNNPVHICRQWYLISRSGWTSVGSGRLSEILPNLKTRWHFPALPFYMCPISPEWCIGATQMLIAQECSFSQLNPAPTLTLTILNFTSKVLFCQEAFWNTYRTNIVKSTNDISRAEQLFLLLSWLGECVAGAKIALRDESGYQNGWIFGKLPKEGGGGHFQTKKSRCRFFI